MAKIRTDDNVIVISGKDKGKTGKVLRVEPAKQRVYVEGLNMIKRHQRPVAGRPNLQVGVIEREGPIHVSNVAIVDPKDHKATRVGVTPRGRRAHARHPALRNGARLMARLKDRYNDEIRGQLVEKFGYTTPMQAPKLVKVTLNMGVGEAKQDSKMLEAAKAQLADDRRPAAEHPPRPQVRRRVQAARGHARRPDGHPARPARLRVPRPPDVGRDPAPARLPGPEPEVLRRPRQLQHGHQGADRSSRRSTTTRSIRSAAWTSRSPRPRRTDAEAFTLLRRARPAVRPRRPPQAATRA